VTQSSYLLVNADDYAYFPGVSRGIIDAHKKGIVTATGMLTNGSSFAEDIEMLRSTPSLDAGVHLNLTIGRPLTANMRAIFRDNAEEFMSKVSFARKYVSGAIKTDDVREEWCAQIEKGLGAELRIWFLNSHEHVHLFPSLFKLVQELAQLYDIPYVRRPTARLNESINPAQIIRSGIVKTLGALNKAGMRQPAARFIGFGQSGRLSEAYLKKILGDLRPGKIYELMCHPGYDDGLDQRLAYLRNYHDWNLEMQTLTGSDIRAACRKENVRVIGYHDIDRISHELQSDVRN